MRHILHNFLFLAVLKFITGKNGEFVTSLMDDCSLEETSVICEHSLPQVLPDNVSSVIVKDFLHVRINNETFTHKSWMTIYFLDITVNLHVKFYLYDYNFSSLKNLKTLGIHSPELTNSDQNHILYGLMKLMSLNLSSCYYLNAAAILNMLETHEESVDTLILDQLAASKDRYLVLDGAFFKLVSKLKIRKLSLSGCNLLFSGSFQITNLSFYLNDFDISNTTLIDISNTSLSTILLKTVLSHLKSLDLSLIKSRFFDIDYGALDKKRLIPICDGSIDNYIGSLFLKVEHLKLNGILSRSVRINNSFFNLSTCISNLKSLQLRSNKLHFLNSTIVWPDTMQLYELDLSSNDLEYLSPFAFGTILSLEVFLLAHNKLYRMSSYMEFQNLLFPFKHLWHLDMSHNQLNKLPFDFFSHNINLTILDLSHNELSSINFKIRHLINLRFLNMEHNKILFIEGSDVSNLALLIETMPKPVEISFAHNPLLCICKSKEFITWLSSYIQVNKKYNYVCTLEGNKIPLDDTALENVKFLCIRSTIVAVSVSIGLTVFCSVSLGTAIVVYRKKQQRKARKRFSFLEDFRNGLLEQKFLCFLSFSSEDEGHEISELYEQLTESLKTLTGIEQELVCVGNRQFNLGFPIVDEILRSITESCVTIFVATNNFCESHWCQMELREAYELNKPIILICKEEIDLTTTPPLMLKIFKQFTRAKLVSKEDGGIEILPDFEQLSRSVVKHASWHYERRTN